ncbi:MAG: deoxyribodipyrimidine photo-lyase/cryptochrome family protein, partial [Pseudomonadota bacterium]
VVEPEYWQLPDTSARQWDFIRECLGELRTDLAGLGQPLVVRTGDCLDVFEQLRLQFGVQRLISHEETGNAWTFARDKRIAGWTDASGVRWHELPQSGIVRGLKTRDGWAQKRDSYVRQDIDFEHIKIPSMHVDPGAIPTSKDLQLNDDPCPGRQTGGRSHALSLLGGFLTQRGRTYRKDMSSPSAGEWTCSRLSPYLAIGAISGREAAQAAAARKAECHGTRDGWTGSLKSFTSRLAWRDHFMQKLEDAPSIETHCLHTAYQSLRQGSDPDRLAAWTYGHTGLPFVDACMRYLRHTGWLNFRMRSMLMAVASYHLWLDWRDTGPVLARLFTDYEPGIHWSQVQMQSGTTGINTVRIYNPVKQGHDQDPDGVFTRRWVPELADIADEFLQEPWKRGGWAGYPPPIVDVKTAAAEARDKIWAVRKGDAFRSEARGIVKKHASRKKDRGFTRDPEPKWDKGQLSFDL